MADDEELTRLAIKMLERDAEKFLRQRSIIKPGPLKANKKFLSATLRHNEISNRRINKRLETRVYHGQSQPPKRRSPEKRKANSPESSSQDSPGPSSRPFSLDKTPIERHLFHSASGISRNRSEVTALTKDSKVCFQLFRNSKTLVKPQVNGVKKSTQTTPEATTTRSNETETNYTDESDSVIVVSSPPSIISVSSTASSVVSSKVKKHKKSSKKHKHKKHDKHRHNKDKKRHKHRKHEMLKTHRKDNDKYDRHDKYKYGEHKKY